MLFGSVMNFIIIVVLTILVGFLINYLFADLFAPECKECLKRKEEVQRVTLTQKNSVSNLDDSDVLDQLFED